MRDVTTYPSNYNKLPVKLTSFQAKLTSYMSTFNNIPIKVNDVGSNFGDAKLLQ